MQGNRILYDNVNQDDWVRIREAVRWLGDFDGFYNVLNMDNKAVLSFEWMEDKKILRVHIEQKPTFMSKWKIQEKIDKIVEKPEIFLR